MRADAFLIDTACVRARAKGCEKSDANSSFFNLDSNEKNFPSCSRAPNCGPASKYERRRLYWLLCTPSRS